MLCYLPSCTFCADTRHFSGSGVGQLLRGYSRSVRLIISCNIIHHVTALSYQGWVIPIHSTATSHFHTPISICIENGIVTLPRLGSHRTLGVICLEVSAEIKNLSTYAVSITKQYLLLPLLIVYDVLEQCVEELCIPGI